MKKIILLIVVFFSSIMIVNAEDKMSKNIYSDPVITGGSGKYDTFMIDFRGTVTPNQTYWALCNWGMDLTDFRKTHSNVDGGGAYAGLQVVDNQKKAIMSFWEVSYTYNGKKTVQRAKMVYPNKATNNFGGEGEGSNYITNFNWRTNSWYRMLLHSWTDYETGNTFVGQWFLDISNKKWYLISYFDTKLKNSSLTGGMSQFQENFSASTGTQYREFNFKNMYVRNNSSKTWVSLYKTKMSYDTAAFNYNTAGSHDYGVKDGYFYGSAGNLILGSQAVYDKNHPANIVYSINQPSTPDLTTYKPTIKAEQNGDKVTVSWVYNSPQKGYELKIYDNDSNKLLTKKIQTRPEVKSYTINIGNTKNYRFELTVNGVLKNESPISTTITTRKVESSNVTSNPVSNTPSNSNIQSNSNVTSNSNTTSDITSNIDSNSNSDIISNDVKSNNKEEKKNNKKDNDEYLYYGIAILGVVSIIIIVLKGKKKNL